MKLTKEEVRVMAKAVAYVICAIILVFIVPIFLAHEFGEAVAILAPMLSYFSALLMGLILDWLLHNDK